MKAEILVSYVVLSGAFLFCALQVAHALVRRQFNLPTSLFGEVEIKRNKYPTLYWLFVLSYATLALILAGFIIRAVISG